MSEKTAIRTIYLYLFSLVGLALTIIGFVVMMNILLKTYVFKNANQTNPYYYSETPPYISSSYENELDKVEAISAKADELKLSDIEKEDIQKWLADYKKWKENEEKRMEFESKRDYVKEENARSMSVAVSLIIVGLPIYLIHWMFITKDIKRNKENN